MPKAKTSTAPLPKKRERKKTFTGCWTCRSRKLKCDEARPACRQCESKSLECGGYGARLHWLPCSTSLTRGESLESSSLCAKPKLRMEAGQRRMILRGNLDTPFTEEEIDRALVEIDASPWSDPVAKGPFHVFHSSIPEEPEIQEEKDIPSQDEWTPPSADLDILDTFDWSKEDPVNNLDDPFLARLESAQYTQDISATNRNSYDSLSDIFQPGFVTNLQLNDVACEDNRQAEFEDYTLTVSSPYRGLDDYPLEPRFMTSQNRLLIYHYVQNVVDLMATISGANSPWKSVHLPRALLGSGELEATGRTSNSRNALLHAILACSAYNLASQFLHTKQDDLARQYRMLGQDLFCKSVLSIGNCMQEEMDGERPKYKELLAAMLSMISIGVMSGSTRSTRLHLEGCEGLIRATKERKSKNESSKTRVLHRVYYYLRVMHASTMSTHDLISKNSQPSTPYVEYPSERESSNMSLDEVADWLGIQKSDESDIDSFRCEFVYGVPQDLFILLGRSVDLVQEINLFWASNPDSLLPGHLVARCDIVEADILDYPLETALASDYVQHATAEAQKIIYHQTHAFHQATIIFFSQHVRPIHRYHLQPYVLTVLEHIWAIELVKTSSSIFGGALLWPGFIAASEAVDVLVQQRFVDWFDAVGSKGIGSSRSATKVLLELWEKRRNVQEEKAGRMVKTGWRTVTEGRDISLMLT